VRVRSVTLFAALALAFSGNALAVGIKGTKGADRIDVIGRGLNKVSCGKGIDVVTADQVDRIARDCEFVSRRISVDTLAAADGQHQTEVEPDVAANRSTAVAVFQVGRYVDGGAAGIGWSTSVDAGRTWRSGILPGLTMFSTPPGTAPRASDPAVAYDAVHGTWLVSSLIVSPAFTALYVSGSTDGRSWSQPVAAVQSGPGPLAYDKEWIGCDNGAASPFRGNCYLVYTDFPAHRLTIQVSRDGGLTWSPGVNASADAGADVEGALPLVQPNGALTIVFLSSQVGLYAVRSVDGGATFAPRIGIAALTAHDVRGLRAPPLPTATVDSSGRLYIAWQDCSFRSGCDGNDIVLSSSTDGVTWTMPQRIPGTGLESVVPGIAADPNAPGRLGLVTYVRTSADQIGVAITRSRDGGATWTKPQRLDARTPQFSWLAETDSGLFAGDYVGATFSAGRFVPVFVLAEPPPGNGRLNEFMMAASLP
jgi:BNR/Asp-box repeat